MANQERGEVGIEVGGVTYTLRPTVNAICSLEERTGKTFGRLASEAEAASISAMRWLLWCYLQECHGDEIKTPEDAGAWMQRAGGLTRIERALSKVATLNRDPDESSSEKPARPRKARAVNGVRSISRRAASV